MKEAQTPIGRGRVLGAATLLLVSSAVGAAWANTGEPWQPVPGNVPAKASAVDGDYVIAAGDTLQLFVWKEPELTREVTVRVDGKITLPLLGGVEAAGRTPEALGAELGELFRRFLEAPHVAVGVSQANGSRFYVVGQVQKPGVFPLLGRRSLVQALAEAGGFKDFAKADRILIIREGQRPPLVLTVNYKRLEAGGDLSQNVALRPGDTILVP